MTGSGNGKVSHATTFVFVRPGHKSDEFELLAFLYEDKLKNYTSWRFMTETGIGKETPWTTGCDGAYQELTEAESPVGFEFSSPDTLKGQIEPIPFLVSRVAGDPNKGSQWHDKYVYIVVLHPDSEPFLRKESKDDDPNETLGVPEFFEASVLWQMMLDRGQPFHRAVLFRTIKRFACNPATYARYKSILENPHSQKVMSTRAGAIRFNDGK